MAARAGPNAHHGAEAIGIASLLREQLDQHYEVGQIEGWSPPTLMAVPERFLSRLADSLDGFGLAFETPISGLPAAWHPRTPIPLTSWHSCLYC